MVVQLPVEYALTVVLNDPSELFQYKVTEACPKPSVGNIIEERGSPPVGSKLPFVVVKLIAIPARQPEAIMVAVKFCAKYPFS